MRLEHLLGIGDGVILQLRPVPCQYGERLQHLELQGLVLLQGYFQVPATLQFTAE